MSWQGTKTWAAGPWQFSDANAYVRDNLVALRRYQMAQQGIGSFADGTGTQTAGFGSSDKIHLHLLEYPLDDDALLTVWYGGQMSGPSGGATSLRVVVYDGDQVALSDINGFTIVQTDFGAMCSSVVVAGRNPGYTISLTVNVGSVSYLIGSFYTITPLA